MKDYNNTLSKTLLVGTIAVLTGCAATQTAIEHGSLQVSTKESETIFLDPVSNTQKTVYVSVKNTSDEDVDIAPQLKTALSSHGYKVINNPNSAHYLLQANVLKIGKMSIAASQSALGGGYGSAIAGAVAGTAAGSFTQSSTGMIAGDLAGGVIGLAADSLVKDVNYTMITDVQISERVGKGVKVNEQFQSHLKNGSATVTSQTSSRDSQYQRYRTRVVSNADKVNLKFQDARPALEQGLVKVISGIF
ncbi:TPA: complement resistance protein TraT [Legionella pneumophila]|uniref:Conjugal transfer protein TraT n=1 Tax=Legionella pneumophila subsp. pneumophila TaxID=91891 RepID=A0A3A6U3R7_LEGPN|nr:MULTISPECIES: complement resistance protein TraT [Legionella]HAT7809678.1 conjugal transfer protein TraT [Legionella pneumophila]MBN5936151.1 complement resistance protein TraT [Legionella anisa]RJY24217.1 conjugal transfer protein TraT [Legionella pneumophila subsp. pneumophila]RJY24665.1 conjugal transfer protein TraT [Legionella pneumophila subsp. pneumophila]HAT7819308.1 conjugal transfer protein TraT [Legionella pneumophila]